MSNKIILKIIDRLKEYLSKLKELQKYSEKDFLTNWQIEWNIGRGLQLSMECAIDLGQEIITGKNLRKPSSYREVFIILEKAKIISSEISQKMQYLARFRNKLVHDYLFLDPKETYKTFQEYLPYLEKFLREVENYLKKINPKS